MARVLVVQHEPTSPPARFRVWLEEAGCALDVRECHRGDTLPPLAQYDGLLVLGGSMDADQDADFRWLPLVRAHIREAARRGVPTLGLCLGHQLATLALGGTVGRNPYGVMLGVLDVGWGCEVLLDPLVGRIAGEGRAFHWNQDVATTLPPGADVLARGAHGEVQAARLAPTVWGLQFHPEIDAAVIAQWAALDDGDDGHEGDGGHDGDRGALGRAGLTPQAVVAQVRDAAAELEAAWAPLARSFATLVRGRAAASGSGWE